MIKAYNKVMRTYKIENTSGEIMLIKPLKFVDIPESYMGDITLRTAIAAREIVVYESNKEGAVIEKAAHEAPAQAPEAPVEAAAPVERKTARKKAVTAE